MKKSEEKTCECFAIYGYLHPEDFQVDQPGHYLLYVFDGKGMCDSEMLCDLFEDVMGKPIDLAATRGFLGPFEGVKAIQHFIYQLTNHVPGKAIALISRDEYNQCLEGSSEASEFLDRLQGQGELIQNEETSEFSNIWNRFFTRR